ncbi:MAG: NUDIX domain-containing protein [bacterium]|nr:NUDIX domain-containing protein [bacterium]
MRDKANSPEEILDLVDRNDTVIGEVVRLQSDSNPYFTVRQASVLIYDSDNRLLLHQRSAMKKTSPLSWSVTAVGHVLKGNSPEQAAHKELKEEAGFDVKLAFVEKEYIRYKYTSYFAYRYIGEYDGQPIIMNSEEIVDIRFVDREEYSLMMELQMPITTGSRKFIENFWDHKFDSLKPKI